MAQHDRFTVLNAMFDVGVVPVFYHKDPATTISVVEACAEGGARVVEFTNRGDLAYKVFTEAVEHVIASDLDVILGVGSIVDAPTAGLYIASGANFVVGPLLNPEVARLCNRRKIPYSPGCGSVSEISQAEELGVEIVKVFPGSEVGGPDSSNPYWVRVHGRASCPPAASMPAASPWRPGSGRVWPVSASAPSW